jgi:hypothetical protein
MAVVGGHIGGEDNLGYGQSRVQKKEPLRPNTKEDLGSGSLLFQDRD